MDSNCEVQCFQREEEEQQNFGLLPFVFCEYELFECVSEIVDISTNRAFQGDRMVQHSKCRIPSNGDILRNGGRCNFIRPASLFK